MSLPLNYKAKVNGSIYHNSGIIGSGSFGTVYLMINNEGKKLAVKIGVDPNMMLQEAVILKSLQHDNIIQYVASEKLINGDILLLTEYCSNGDLHSYINTFKGQMIPEQQILKWTYQIVSGIKYIHEHGFVHRDIKSGNVLLDANFKIKICDFGSARALPPVDQVTQPTMLMTSFVGTQLYMSPEMLNGLNYTEQTDIYSLGAVMYEMAHMFYGGIMQLSILYSAVQISVNGVVLTIPGYSEQLRILIAGLMNSNPNVRPTATQILADPIFQNTGPPLSIISPCPQQQVQPPSFVQNTVPHQMCIQSIGTVPCAVQTRDRPMRRTFPQQMGLA